MGWPLSSEELLRTKAEIYRIRHLLPCLLTTQMGISPEGAQAYFFPWWTLFCYQSWLYFGTSLLESSIADMKCEKHGVTLLRQWTNLYFGGQVWGITSSWRQDAVCLCSNFKSKQLWVFETFTECDFYKALNSAGGERVNWVKNFIFIFLSF